MAHYHGVGGGKYSVVEYIESTGTQYIDTGFTPNNKSRIVIDFAATDVSTTNNLVGSRSSTTSKAFTFSVSGSGYWRIGYNTSSPETSVLADTERHVADLNKNVLYLDSSVLYTATEAEFTGYASIYIGAINAAGRGYMGYVKIYSCQIYDDGTLIRDYITCINPDGVVGLFDKVNHQFYANAGTGTFSVGEATGEIISTTVGVAREITKRYRGVDNVARAVKKAYHEIDGVERLYFAELAKVTISGNDRPWGDNYVTTAYSDVTINGKKYTAASDAELELPIGTVISCRVHWHDGSGSHAATCRDLTKITVNGVDVVKNLTEDVSGTYEYTVTKDASIYLVSERRPTNQAYIVCAGYITITEQ